MSDEDIDNSVEVTETLLNGVLSCYYVVGFTSDGEAFHLIRAKTDMDKYALDLMVNSAKETVGTTIAPQAPVYHASDSDTGYQDDQGDGAQDWEDNAE